MNPKGPYYAFLHLYLYLHCWLLTGFHVKCVSSAARLYRGSPILWLDPPKNAPSSHMYYHQSLNLDQVSYLSTVLIRIKANLAEVLEKGWLKRRTSGFGNCKSFQSSKTIAVKRQNINMNLKLFIIWPLLPILEPDYNPMQMLWSEGSSSLTLCRSESQLQEMFSLLLKVSLVILWIIHFSIQLPSTN